MAELLNPAGSHEQGNVFLKLFLSHFDIADFDPSSVVVKVEFHTGAVNEDTGGRIDILITDARRNHIIIENKIYAREQDKQMQRYAKYGGEKAHLFFLTLEGVTSETADEVNYRPISYKEDILNWLENCKKEAVSLPILRETITQYIYLIKYLTNQTMNHKMQEEIVNLILSNRENFNSFITISETTTHVFATVLKSLEPKLNSVVSGQNLNVQIDLLDREWYKGFTYIGPQLEKYNIDIRFQFEGRGTENLIFGFRYIDKGSKKLTPKMIQEKFNNWFGGEAEGENFIAVAQWPDAEYRKWNKDNLYLIYNGAIDNQIKNVVNKMIEIINEVEQAESYKTK